MPNRRRSISASRVVNSLIISSPTSGAAEYAGTAKYHSPATVTSPGNGTTQISSRRSEGNSDNIWLSVLYQWRQTTAFGSTVIVFIIVWFSGRYDAFPSLAR